MRRTQCYLFTNLLFFVIFAMSVTPIYAQGASPKQSRDDGKPISCRQKLDYSQSFYDRLPVPGGNWTASYLPERPASPVVVAGINGFISRQPSKERGFAITCAEFKNHSDRAVRQIRLRWVLTTDEDRGTILLRDDSTLLDVSLAPGEKREVDFDDIFFSEISRPLVKDGVLDGNYLWVFGVSEVLYEDGTMWKSAVEINSF